MFSRTWLAVLAGSAALWGMGQLGGGASFPGPNPGGPALPAPVSPAHAAAAASALAACLDEAASLDAPASSASGGQGQGALSVERRYRERCRPVPGGEAFDAFAVVYGERSRFAVAAILDREARLAAELAAGPQAAVLDREVVWAAALRRAASDVRGFEAELAAWFDARSASAGDGPVLALADPAGPAP